MHNDRHGKPLLCPGPNDVCCRGQEGFGRTKAKVGISLAGSGEGVG